MGQANSRLRERNLNIKYNGVRNAGVPAKVPWLPSKSPPSSCKAHPVQPSAPSEARPVQPPENPENTALLEGFIRSALAAIDADIPSRIFRPSPNFPAPMLRKGVTNRIIIFPGSFNPPHMGHRLLLTHAFFRGRFENLIAAIIPVQDTKTVQKKLQYEVNALVFKQEERVQLWEDSDMMPWSWVNPNSQDMCRAFEKYLYVVAKAADFDIEYVYVMGSDCFNSTMAKLRPNAAPFGAPMIISDATRSIPRTSDGSPMRLAGHTEWLDASAGVETGRSIAMLERKQYSALAVLRLLYPREGEVATRQLDKPRLSITPRERQKWAQGILQECLHMSGRTWECEYVHDPKQRIVCVPARNALGYAIETELSATAIRRILRKESPFQQSPTLYRMALNPQLLAKMVEAKRTWQLTLRQQAVGRLYVKSLETRIRADAQAGSPGR